MVIFEPLQDSNVRQSEGAAAFERDPDLQPALGGRWGVIRWSSRRILRWAKRQEE